VLLVCKTAPEGNCHLNSINQMPRHFNFTQSS
jgi:hypothetical protein